MPGLQDDPVPRLLLTVLEDDRCGIPWCGQPKVRGYASAGLRKVLGDRDVTGPFCLNPRCPNALKALGPLDALKTSLREL